MASLTSSSITVAFANGDRLTDTIVTNRKKIVDLKLTVASGEWPAAGIPLVASGKAGFIRNLDLHLMGPRLVTASGRTLLLTLTTGNKLRAFQNALMSGTGRSVQAFATTITVGSKIVYVQATGW